LVNGVAVQHFYFWCNIKFFAPGVPNMNNKKKSGSTGIFVSLVFAMVDQYPTQVLGDIYQPGIRHGRSNLLGTGTNLLDVVFATT